MAFSSGLGGAGFTPKHISTSATVHLERVDGKARITKIHLETRAEVPGITKEAFLKIAEDAKSSCPVSVALSSVEITLDAQLI
jgi:osmotically inducible protein OsmC